jgi:hypothetical protein
MFAKLYDVVIVDARRREVRERIDEVYREVLKGLKNYQPYERPVEVFLERLSDCLTPEEMERVIVVMDVSEGQLVEFGIRKTEKGIALGRSTYPFRKYLFPKYPFEGEQYSFEELINLLKRACPFIGAARRREDVPG